MHLKTKITFYSVFLPTLFFSLVPITLATDLRPLTIGPLGSERFFVPQKDNTDGSGANFIVT